MNTAREFADRLAELLGTERRVLAQFLLLLAEFDRRKLYRELGHPTLFSFLTVELKLSAGAAQYRKTAAELIQRFPAIEAAIGDGRLCLSSVIEVAKVLTPENEAEILPRFYRLSARDAAFVAASIRPVEKAPERELLVPIARPEAKLARSAGPAKAP
ncbi:MAG TPA: HNH endonuclease, partial [Anaeromyxobacteraceae bacterium]|nr:HNH endonuclease [Anaeromyxobacteraceae bacterium]